MILEKPYKKKPDKKYSPSRKWVLIIWFAAIIIPVLAMSNCSGWSTSDVRVGQCFVDTQFLRGLANNLYGTMFLSVFTLGLPILAYLFVIWMMTQLVKALIGDDRDF